MTFAAGDKVSVLDEAITGKVIKIVSDSVFIETDDGFELQFQPFELVKLTDTFSIKPHVFSETTVSEVISEKEQTSKRASVKIKPKERNLPVMEVDLHIHKLTDKDKYMSNFEILNLQLETAGRQLEFAINKRIQKIVFIHGVGEGVLKAELETLFRRYNNLKYYDAEYQKYGLGATEVYIFQNVR